VLQDDLQKCNLRCRCCDGCRLLAITLLHVSIQARRQCSSAAMNVVIAAMDVAIAAMNVACAAMYVAMSFQ
jgi:hypothetical protein